MGAVVDGTDQIWDLGQGRTRVRIPCSTDQGRESSYQESGTGSESGILVTKGGKAPEQKVGFDQPRVSKQLTVSKRVSLQRLQALNHIKHTINLTVGLRNGQQPHASTHT